MPPASTAFTPPALSVRNVRKRFGSVQALVEVNLDFSAGEIHCILGENGAGKSTLMNILDGVFAADAGQILIDGQAVHLTSPHSARAAGIGMVHQHFTLVDAMTVSENLALSMPAKAGGGGWRMGSWYLDQRAIAEEAGKLAERVGIALPAAHLRVRDLSVGTRQRLEILKALIAADKVLILDEPTAVLTPAEVDQLFVLLRELRAQRRLVIFITHKLREVKEVGDRVSIMRHGRIVATHDVAAVSEATLAQDMIGEVLAPSSVGTPPAPTAATVLALQDVTVDGPDHPRALAAVSLEVRAGEVLGIAGVDGNGQRELFEVLCGLRIPSTGQVRIAEHAPSPLTPASARAAGLACIPPDRHREGLALPMSVAENFLLSTSVLERFCAHGFLDHEAARRLARESAAQLDIRYADLDQPVSGLSGGNQQRIIVGRELSQEPRVLVAVSPTRGLDVQATRTVGAVIHAAAARGCAVVLISTDLDELFDLSHRIAVLFRGHLSTPMPAPFDAVRIGSLMAGTV